jgi:hypothetical protein
VRQGFRFVGTLALSMTLTLALGRNQKETL